ncbi:MAG: hypothetical protein ACYCS7_06750 [Acidimicrobiales bacterium]
MSFNESAEPPDAEALLRRVVEIIDNAKSMPLSASVLISKDEVVELLEDAIERLPDELRQARWMLREREEFLAKTRREADGILESARVRSERMVQRTEIVRQAQNSAGRIVEDAQAEARRLAHEADDFCDQKLAAFEITLERTMRSVQAGREKLQATTAIVDPEGLGVGLPGTTAGPGLSSSGPAGDEAFFDQDQLER